ncbi:MAG: alpha/beta fold hydrolase [Saprospiraceae bacterium]
MKNTWLDRNEYPFESNYFDIEGQKMHYIDEGKGETILFVHGTPSWSFDFRHIIIALRSKYRCIAIDHIGFGLSDKPAQFDYETASHSRRLATFIDHIQLKDITLVVHDFGGPIGLNVACKSPNLFKRLVIMNSWLWNSQNDPDYIKMKSVLKSPLLSFLYHYFNFSAKYLLPGSFGDKKLSNQILKQYTGPLSSREERSGTVAFARSLLNDQEWFESIWEKADAIAGKPTLLIWGMKDKFVKPSYLLKFQSRFLNSTTIELATCGHFPQEEEPKLVAQAILAHLQDAQ